MKFLRILGFVVLAVVAIVIVLGLIAPHDYELKRTTVIKAPAEVIYKNISTFQAFEQWNPFRKMDTAQTTTVEGTDGTVGAKYSWNGKKTGKGSMTAAKLDPNKEADYDMVFYTPFGEMKSTSSMSVEAADGGQKVTWEFKGRSPFPWNIMNLIGDMNKEMGPTFDDGLNTLKSMSESAAAMPSYEVKEVDWTAKNCLSIRKTVEMKDLSAFFGTNYGKINAALTKGGGKMAGAPLGVYYTWDMKEMKTDVAAALPYTGGKNFGNDVQELNLPATKVLSVDYYGAYGQNEKPAYDALDAKLKAMGQDKPAMAIEEYLTDPMNEKDTAKWHTVIYYVPK